MLGNERNRGAYLEPPSKFLVEKEARELSSARPLQELNKDLPKWALHLIRSLLKLLIPHEMGLIVISLELLQQSLKLPLLQILVNLPVEQPLHLIEIRRVKPRRQQRLLYPFFLLLPPSSSRGGSGGGGGSRCLDHGG